MEIVSVDIGGTHARFAIAGVAAGRVVRLGTPVTLRIRDHVSLASAWKAFAAQAGRTLPRAAGIALASPIAGDAIKLTNNPWIVRPALIAEQLQVDAVTLINDFVAVGHAVGQLDEAAYVALCGPARSLAVPGSLTVCGPGTGLGVCQLIRDLDGYSVLASEGGHIAYAPLDDFDDRLLDRLRQRYWRVSVERVCSGAGLVAIYDTLAQIAGAPATSLDDRQLWDAALAGTDKVASDALAKFCAILGSVAGDLALAHGSTGVVVAGGLGLRLAEHLRGSEFAQHFVAKNRFGDHMRAIPVRIITYPQPGLFGAAAAFAQEHTVLPTKA